MQNRTWTQRAQRGFSLIELLMASVVAAAAAALLIGGLVAANRSADLRIEQVVAGQLLASQLALLDDQAAGEAPAHGTFSEPLEAYEWSLQHADASLEPLTQVALAVTHNDHETHVVTLRRVAEQP